MRIVVAALCLLACGQDRGLASTTSGQAGGGETSGTGGNENTGGDENTGGSAGAPPGTVPMFVAQGGVGRTIVSYDDGQSWVGDRAWDSDGDPLMCGMVQSGRCYETTCSYQIGDACVQMTCCDHAPDVPKGVIYGDGQFVATWGWGQPGAVQRSVNGIDWTSTHPGDSFGGIAFGADRFVVASRTPFWSADGIDWTPGDEADFRNDDDSIMWSVRRFAYADYDGGRFVAVASGDSSRDMLVSSDGGQTWWRPSVIPADCAHEVSTYGGIVSGNGIIVIVDMAANACRSTDGGHTWSVAPTGLDQILSHGVWTGSEFVFWGDDAFMVSSADGESWTKTPMTTPTRIGPVAQNPETGSYVALGSVWTGYEGQQFMRSTDGLTWETLPDSQFTQSHPLFYITFGYGQR